MGKKMGLNVNVNIHETMKRRLIINLQTLSKRCFKAESPPMPWTYTLDTLQPARLLVYRSFDDGERTHEPRATKASIRLYWKCELPEKHRQTCCAPVVILASTSSSQTNKAIAVFLELVLW